MSEDSRARVSREAGEIQRLAADPSRSVALRASAGSGKTKVLVDRILRLLLVKARLKSVVALTFTRKAAVEIRERLRERLGELLKRQGFQKLLAATGIAPDPRHVQEPRHNPYIFWKEDEVEGGFQRDINEFRKHHQR